MPAVDPPTTSPVVIKKVPFRIPNDTFLMTAPEVKKRKFESARLAAVTENGPISPFGCSHGPFSVTTGPVVGGPIASNPDVNGLEMGDKEK